MGPRLRRREIQLYTRTPSSAIVHFAVRVFGGLVYRSVTHTLPLDIRAQLRRFNAETTAPVLSTNFIPKRSIR